MERLDQADDLIKISIALNLATLGISFPFFLFYYFSTLFLFPPHIFFSNFVGVIIVLLAYIFHFIFGILYPVVAYRVVLRGKTGQGGSFLIISACITSITLFINFILSSRFHPLWLIIVASGILGIMLFGITGASLVTWSPSGNGIHRRRLDFDRRSQDSTPSQSSFDPSRVTPTFSSPLPGRALTQCGECGAELEFGDKFCYRCGSPR